MTKKTFLTFGCFGSVAVLLPLSGCVGSLPEAQRPNIVVILADDMGYSDIGCYGSEIQTPNLDGLAAKGLRWTQFYNNARSCPSRAALMTGLYPHQAGMGWMAAADMQRAPYQGYLNRNCVTIAEVLRESGYGTYMTGKWHLSTDRQNKGRNSEGWPCRRGFDHFYGIPTGATNYFQADALVQDNTPVKHGDGFYSTTAFADTAAAYITRHDFRKKPLFLYLAFNAPHWPLHARQEDIDKYQDTYKVGWDKIRSARFRKQRELGLFQDGVTMSPRDSAVAAWDSLKPEERQDFAQRMAIYAAQVDAMDQGIGHVIQALKDAGQFDNTVILFMSDNGACAEFQSSGKSKAPTGWEDTFESYRINWANVSSTPYREYKHWTHEGGIATPLIVSWPTGIPRKMNGLFVREYGYFTDIMATCSDLAGADYPTEYAGNAILPMEGVSLKPNFSGATTGRGMTFWEHEANIAVRDGKWKLVVKNQEGRPFSLADKLELYDMEQDPTELHNLASRDSVRVRRMFTAWTEWAERVGALPLSTESYGQRQQKFKRIINGEFEDNFGDWDLSSRKPAEVTFSIDENARLSGRKSALVDITAAGDKPADAMLRWIFPLEKAATIDVGFQYTCSEGNTVFLRIESLKDLGNKRLDKAIQLKPESGSYSFRNIRLPEKGRYQIAFYFGKSRPGKIWIDSVELKFNEHEQ